MPERRASAGERKAMTPPATAISPASAWNSPVITLTSVLLPAPFAPIKAWISPALSSSAAERSAITDPKRLAMPVTRKRSLPSALTCRLRGSIPTGDGDRRPKSIPPRRSCRARSLGSRTFAGEDLIHVVLRVGLHIDRHAVEGIELRIIGGLELGKPRVAVVPDDRRDLDEMRMLLFLEHVERKPEARAADGRRIAHRR